MTILKEVLPDGSGYVVVSFALPADHWSIVDQEGTNVPPMPFRMGKGKERNEFADKIRAAGKYAFRASTRNGKDADLDPDALLQNLVVGLLGYWTRDGLSSDEWANPKGKK